MCILYPSINLISLTLTLCSCYVESRWLTEYAEKYCHRLPHPPKETVRVFPSTFETTPTSLFADKYRRTEYETAYGTKVI